MSKCCICGKEIKNERINIDYVVSLFGDDSHYYKEDDDVRCSPDILGATKFDTKENISILDIVEDVCESQRKYMPENEVASLFDLDTLEEVYEKDEDYFISSGLVKIIPVYKNKEIKNEILEGNNPDPLKDENDNYLADDPKYNMCCYDCNHLYVISFRICQIYELKEQCDLIQKKVLELRKSWLNKEQQDGKNDR